MRRPSSRANRTARALVFALSSLAASAGAGAIDTHELVTQFSSHGSATTADGRFLFTVSRYDSVAIIDPLSCQYVGAIPLGALCSRPSGAAIGSGRLFVSSATGVVAIDTALFEPVETFPVPAAIGNEHGSVAAARLSSDVFAVNGTTRDLVRIDAAALAVTGTLSLGSDHTSLALAPNERTVYVVNTERGRLLRIDAKTLAVQGEAPVDHFDDFLDIPMEVTVAADGRVLVAYVGTDYKGRVAVFSSALSRLGTVFLPDYSTGVAADRLGGHAVTGGGFVLRQTDMALVADFSRRSVGLYSVSVDPETGAFHSTNDNDRYVVRVEQLPPPIRLLDPASVVPGGWVGIELHAPTEAGRVAQVVLSKSVASGVRVDAARRCPLDYDDLFRLSRRGTSDDFVDFTCRLDSEGRARVFVRLSEAVLPETGVLHAAYVTYDSEPSRTAIRFVSGALRVDAR